LQKYSCTKVYLKWVHGLGFHVLTAPCHTPAIHCSSPTGTTILGRRKVDVLLDGWRIYLFLFLLSGFL
jgi:hypothetical protein